MLPAARHDIAKLADFFKRNPQREALIEGNTDNSPDVDFSIRVVGRLDPADHHLGQGPLQPGDALGAVAANSAPSVIASPSTAAWTR